MYKTAYRISKPSLIAKSQPAYGVLLLTAIFSLLSLLLPEGRQAAGSSILRPTAFSDNGLVSPTTDGGLQVDFDWEMQQRFGQDANNGTDLDGKPAGWTDPFRYEDNWVTLSPSREFIQPPSWQVTLKAASTNDVAISSYKWEIWGEPSPIYKTTSNLRHAFKKQGAYPVKLTITAADGRTARVAKNVVVRDLLIVSLGDSVASGEGNPHQDSFPFLPAVWANSRCHRSIYSGPAQAAMEMEKKDRHTSVTFISLACSGAKIEHLTKTAQKEEFTDPQISALKKMLCPADDCSRTEEQRQIDALLISAGANDLKFSEIVKECVINEDCEDMVSFKNVLPQRFAALATNLDELRSVIETNLKPCPVFVTEYFDPTKYFTDQHPSGYWCLMEQFPEEYTGSEIPGEFGIRIDPQESEWAYNEIIVPLNRTLKLKVTQDFQSGDNFQWNFVDEIMSDFFHHGYCSSERWIVRGTESLERQGDIDGTMHPNKQGHLAYAKRIQEAVWYQASNATTSEGELREVNCEHIAGWAWDRSLPFDKMENGQQADHPIYVSLYDGYRLVTSVLANRADPTLRYSRVDGSHTFIIPIPDSLKDGNQHTLSVRIAGTGIILGSAENLLLCAPFSYEGSLDPANCEQITGYAWDRSKPATIFDVDIFDGDKYLGTARANQTRPALAFGGTSVSIINPGSVNHGFVFDLPDSVRDGRLHAISARFEGTGTILNNSPRPVSCLASSFQGSLDSVNCSVISGYAWNKDQPGMFLDVDIFDGSTRLARVTANQIRPVQVPVISSSNNQPTAPKPGSSNHGFTFAVPDNLKDGKPHVISVRFVGSPTNAGPNPTTSVNLSSSPQTLTCIPSYFELVAKHSGKCLDIEGGAGATANGAKAQQWTCSGTANQQWRFIPVSGGYYQILARHSGKALDVMGGVSSSGNGIKVQQWDYVGGANQQWLVTAVGDGSYKITSRHSGKTLDIEGGLGAVGNGAKAQQWDYIGGDNQKWVIKPLYYELVAKHSGKCLDIEGGVGATANGAKAQQWTCSGTANQQWQFIPTGGGYYQILARHSGKALDVMGGVVSSGNGIKVQQWDYVGGTNQQWLVTAVGDGSYKITSRHSGKTLDIEGGLGAVGDGAKAQQWDYLGGNNQKWIIRLVAPFPAN